MIDRKPWHEFRMPQTDCPERLVKVAETIAETTAPPLSSPFKTQERPSPWLIVSEYAKTAITVAAALLAFSVPFYKEVLGQTPDTLSKCLLGFLWVTVAAVALSALFILSNLSNYLRQTPNHKTPETCAKWATCSFIAMGVALVTLVLLGWDALFNSSPSPVSQREHAEKLPLLTPAFLSPGSALLGFGMIERFMAGATAFASPTRAWISFSR